MLIKKSNKNEVIRFLKSYSNTLGKRVKPGIYNKISEVYQMILNRTTEDARYIEALESEADNVLEEYLSSVCAKKNITAYIYLGRQASVYAREKIIATLKNSVAVYTFPTNYETETVVIFISFLDESYSELYDIDYAMNMLKYYD